MDTNWLTTVHTGWAIPSMFIFVVLTKFISERFNKGLVNDNDVQALYPLGDILYLGFLIPAAFPAWLLYQNIQAKGNKRVVTAVLLSGVLYTIFQGWILFKAYQLNIDLNTWGFNFLFCAVQIPAVLMQLFLWRHYLGDVTYRKRFSMVFIAIAFGTTYAFLELSQYLLGK